MKGHKKIRKNVLSESVMANVEAMLAAPERGIGPDIVIIVSSSFDGADFWQKRLTGPDGLRGSGAVIKSSALVFSVSESNWHGPAGNGLGTINAFYQAGVKAKDMGVISPAGEGKDGIFLEFLSFSRGKSVFMFHTAGKGTRLSPITAAEHNSKSRIKLPGLLETKEGMCPITVLEAAIRASSVYAPSREGRLSVFWGDQVILNELDVTFDGKYHIEIFAQTVPLDESISSYGFLVRTERGGCLLREKLDIGRVRAEFPELSNSVHRSIGSFSLSFGLFGCLAMSESRAIMDQEGELNTDRDWWQALTSELGEYIGLASAKGASTAEAERRWRKTRKVWEDISSRKAPDDDSSGMMGFRDVGAGSLWMDYGRVSCLMKNALILAGNSPDAEIARVFFRAEENFIDSFQAQGKDIRNSVILDSRIEKGKLKNCVVISSDIEEVYAEDSLIVGSKMISLRSDRALCYNAVSRCEDLGQGVVLANIFHPAEGRVTMRTDISRDGQADWESGEKIMGNKFSYRELAEKISCSREEDMENTRRETIEREGWNG
jgi:hypothetical protein